MRKIILSLVVLFAMFSLSALPKYTMLDYNAGNTPEYIEKFGVKLDLSTKVTQEYLKYIYHIKKGTWLIEFEDGKQVFVSFYNDKLIACAFLKE